MKRTLITTILVLATATLTTCLLCVLADPGRVRVTRQSQQEGNLTAFTLHASHVGESNVVLRLQVPDDRFYVYRFARLHLHVRPEQRQKVDVSVPVRLDRNEKDTGWTAQLVLLTDLARRAELELSLHSSDPNSNPPPFAQTGIVYDIDVKTYLAETVLHLSSLKVNDTGGKDVTMRLARIPAGQFLMSSPETEAGRESGEGPQHLMTIGGPFYMGVCEVTQEQYEAVVGSNPSHFKGASNPVDSVSWDDAVAFCKKLSAKTGMTVRLPTEAEWEYASRAGSKTRFSYGDDDEKLGDYAWYAQNSGGTIHPVAQRKANDWGLYDMHGNLWEWCSEWYDDTHDPNAKFTDPQRPAPGTSRVLRGGSWDNLPQACRSAIRRGRAPNYGYMSFGFRVVVDFKPVDPEPAIPARDGVQ